MFRTLTLLRSLQGAHHSLKDAQATVQQACDYRWLREALRGGVITRTDAALADGTPAVVVTLSFVATPARLAGGKWPEDPAERERCFVVGTHACRAAGAPRYRTLESLSQGLVHGAAAVLTDTARFQYLLDQQALRLTWRRPGGLPEALAHRLLGTETAGHHGCFLLEVRVPSPPVEGAPSGAWLDRMLDRYRRILPRSAAP
ncbi:hypothetical protein BDK63_001201 [Halomonas campaniensis]|uniref:Uncharacterized protein n=1 Tax=Halomonas campaniensis TaxID=213554 RepID=A0A7W5K1R6_9GAMM|nr:hypothetical protein [Halomonas campaniensis]MBB3330344.1 hypothetical protein [Halomonas campaniensis]